MSCGQGITERRRWYISDQSHHDPRCKDVHLIEKRQCQGADTNQCNDADVNKGQFFVKQRADENIYIVKRKEQRSLRKMIRFYFRTLYVKSR